MGSEPTAAKYYLRLKTDILWSCLNRFKIGHVKICIYIRFSCCQNQWAIKQKCIYRVSHQSFNQRWSLIIIIFLLLSKTLFQTYWRTAIHWGWSENLLGPAVVRNTAYLIALNEGWRVEKNLRNFWDFFFCSG